MRGSRTLGSVRISFKTCRPYGPSVPDPRRSGTTERRARRRSREKLSCPSGTCAEQRHHLLLPLLLADAALGTRYQADEGRAVADLAVVAAHEFDHAGHLRAGVVEFVGSDDGEIRLANIYITLVPRSQRSMSQRQWEQKMMPLLSQVPDGQLSFSQNGGGRDIQLYLTGDNPELVEATGHKVLAEIRALPEVRDARIKGDLPRPGDRGAPADGYRGTAGRERRKHQRNDSHRDARRPAAERREVLPERPADSDPRQPDRKLARRDLTTLENLPVPTASGASVPLKTVADLTFGQGSSAVRRYNQSRRVFLEADMTPGVVLGTATKKIYATPHLEASARRRAPG